MSYFIISLSLTGLLLKLIYFLAHGILFLSVEFFLAFLSLTFGFIFFQTFLLTSLGVKYCCTLSLLCLEWNIYWCVLKFLTVHSFSVRTISHVAWVKKDPPGVLTLGTSQSHQARANFMLNSHSEDLHTTEAV